jgi:hypothetical protein
MFAISDLPLFLDERFIDELWIRVTREGLTTEELKEASQKIAAKVNISGISGLLKHVFSLPDLNIGLDGELLRKGTEKIQINPLLRALLLPELIPDIVSISCLDKSGSFEKLTNGAFVRILCNNVALTPLPTLAAHIRYLTLKNVDDSKITQPDQISVDEIFKLVDNATNANRAITFDLRTDEEGSIADRLLHSLYESESVEVFNVLSVCNDDLSLIASSILLSDTEAVLFSVLEDRFVNRSLAAFIGQRPVGFFGQIAYVRDETTAPLGVPRSIGLRTAAVSLC